jgi:hypothetical protein
MARGALPVRVCVGDHGKPQVEGLGDQLIPVSAISPGGQRAGPPSVARKTRLPKRDAAGDQAAQDRAGLPISAAADSR